VAVAHRVRSYNGKGVVCVMRAVRAGGPGSCALPIAQVRMLLVVHVPLFVGAHLVRDLTSNEAVAT